MPEIDAKLMTIFAAALSGLTRPRTASTWIVPVRATPTSAGE